jgi:hypothetical protein
MTTAHIAIIISLISASIAGLSLGWNIYRDVILKPKLEIFFGIRSLVGPGIGGTPEYLVLTATNFGPGTTTATMIYTEETSLWKKLLRKTKHAVVIHDYKNPLSGTLPKKLEVGDKLDLLLPYNEECFLRKNWNRVGLYDIFGRFHSAKWNQIREARKRWINDFEHEKV